MRKKNSGTVVTPWFIRLSLYVTVAGVGLVLTLLGYTDERTVDGWLDQLGPLAATIGGIVAALYTTRDETEDDPAPAPVAPPAVPVAPPRSSAGNATLEQLRELVAENTGRGR